MCSRNSLEAQRKDISLVAASIKSCSNVCTFLYFFQNLRVIILNTCIWNVVLIFAFYNMSVKNITKVLVLVRVV